MYGYVNCCCCVVSVPYMHSSLYSFDRQCYTSRAPIALYVYMLSHVYWTLVILRIRTFKKKILFYVWKSIAVKILSFFSLVCVSNCKSAEMFEFQKTWIGNGFFCKIKLVFYGGGRLSHVCKGNEPKSKDCLNVVHSNNKRNWFPI